MKALTFKEKQDVLEDLFKKYHRAVLQLKCLEERNFYPTIQFDTVKEIFVEKKNQLQLFQIEKVNYSKGMVILKLKGIETPEQAETLRNCYIKMDRKNAKKLPEGTYYIADLIGLDVYSDEEELLGKVDYIYNTGSSDIYVVKNDEGKEILLPAIKDVLKQVDLENKKIIVHIIEGLI